MGVGQRGVETSRLIKSLVEAGLSQLAFRHNGVWKVLPRTRLALVVLNSHLVSARKVQVALTGFQGNAFPALADIASQASPLVGSPELGGGGFDCCTWDFPARRILNRELYSTADI